MTNEVKKFLELLKKQEYRKMRKKIQEPSQDEFFFKIMSLTEPLLFEDDEFGFNIGFDLTIRESSRGGNLTPDYNIIHRGLDAVYEEIKDSINNTDDSEKIKFGKEMLNHIDILFDICKKHRETAKSAGNEKLYKALEKIPHKGADTFYEACVFIKLINYFLRCFPVSHIGLGRFDQYMMPFYLHDRENGVSDEEIFETLEKFFIAINLDTDTYHGIQQGDNGQSIILGGFDKDGKSMYNALSKMCLKASLELNLIDPKINLRVGKNTPDEIYEYATHLTKQGLGFPQYCNDDVVVPGLIKLGYEKEDALNYTVAACWEFIIPGKGADIPNIDVMDFPLIVSKAVNEHLEECDTFSELLEFAKQGIAKQCDEFVGQYKTFYRRANPLLSVFTEGCSKSLTDIYSGGARYCNYGVHGLGIANAADALAAIADNVYNKKTVSKSKLLEAINANFEGYEEIRNILRNSPKMGNNDDLVDDIAGEIMKAFSDNLNNRENGCGGIWRAGTGSAMEYFRGDHCPATADGRKKGEPYSSSFSPALDIKTNGILSVIQSFTKYDMTEIINGGPLTIEIHDTVFRNEEGIKKVAMLVKAFVELGGHQLQLNSVNRERLLDAQKHPENYKNLIVRVWGWSGYFNELDTRFQNHVIRRTEYLS